MTAIDFRPITPDDLPFLYRLYASTRESELAPLMWSAAEKEAFLTMQFNAQHQYYTQQFTEARFDVILCDGQMAGRLYVDPRPHEIGLVDIALLPEYRNQGIGSRLIRDLMADAQARGLALRLHVEQFNPALRLYQRLGFRVLANNGVYLHMEWNGDAGQADAG